MSLLDTIANFYERLVADEIEESRQAGDSEDFLQDVMCVALNRLPPRYYRHSVDMMFYLADQEQQEMHDKVRKAVSDARTFVRGHQRD